ncbi:hypothetical protein DU500_13130 [Haloplanus rubicundus]|uniref:DUF1102 domain-containing protein n=1 Tax=Haloplanus rubicundus TaxID=1547898 RepID=A0A345E518_9EURY|nr:hypothetical protein [Haloplanus rubicundus]AXG07290.1 hypothetical protein DU500_13130 [Haloplanus rubicundus]
MEDDDDAYLSLDPSSDLSRTTTSGGQLEFYIPGIKTRAGIGDTPEGNGVQPNSRYTFGDLLVISNQGSDPVEVFGSGRNVPSGFERLGLVDSDRNQLLTSEADATELYPGESFNAGLFIETGDANVQQYQLALRIRADPITEQASDAPRGPSGILE